MDFKEFLNEYNDASNTSSRDQGGHGGNDDDRRGPSRDQGGHSSDDYSRSSGSRFSINKNDPTRLDTDIAKSVRAALMGPNKFSGEPKGVARKEKILKIANLKLKKKLSKKKLEALSKFFTYNELEGLFKNYKPVTGKSDEL
mgnify:CR=1 FL=1